jgi:hypothetical protein
MASTVDSKLSVLFYEIDRKPQTSTVDMVGQKLDRIDQAPFLLTCREFECKFTSKMGSYSILPCFGKVSPVPVKELHLEEKVRNKFYLAY